LCNIFFSSTARRFFDRLAADIKRREHHHIEYIVDNSGSLRRGA
jgi:predicted secreted Zn-dependent protease